MQGLNSDERQSGIDSTLYDLYGATIFTYLYQQVANTQDAEDLLLEVFIAALKHETLCGLAGEQQLAWLRRVARNKVIDRYRRAALVSIVPLEQITETADSQPSPEQQALQRESYQRLYHSLEQLPPLQQQLVRLRYGNGLRLVEIAEMLNKPEGTVRSILLRTLRHLRAIYEQYHQDKGESR